MKRFLLFTLLLQLTFNASAQAPEKMSYQAIIRNAGNSVVASATVGMRISILNGSTTIYSETQSPTTNVNGLISIEIGGGSGFADIDWSNGTYFIKTETDPDGGNSYTITGQSQLLSVPYALHSKKADDVTSGVYASVTTNQINFQNNDTFQYGSLTRDITLSKAADVLITYNTVNANNGSGTGAWFYTYIYVNNVPNPIFTQVGKPGFDLLSNSGSGVIQLGAGTHTIAVYYRTSFSTAGYSFPNTGSLTIKELK